MNLLYEFKNYEVKEDADNYIIEGYGSVAQNVDLGDDIVDNGAFTDDLMARENGKRPALWQHNSNEPVGIVESREDNKGLYSKFMLPKSDTFVSGRVMPQVKVKSVTGLSIGYSVVDAEMVERDGKRCRLLKKLRLHEVSLVTFPMNESARIMACKEYLINHNVKSLEEDKAVPSFKDYAFAASDTEWDSTKAIKQIREKTKSGDSPSENYKDGFMYFDPENQDSFGGYKMPFVYVVDGQFKVVPRALSAIVGAIRGARGTGVDIPESDKNKIKSQINKYYKKLGREEPFKKDTVFIDKQTLNCLDKKNMSIIFEKDVILSSQAQETLIKAFAHDKHGSVSNDESKNDVLGQMKELDTLLDSIK